MHTNRTSVAFRPPFIVGWVGLSGCFPPVVVLRDTGNDCIDDTFVRTDGTSEETGTDTDTGPPEDFALSVTACPTFWPLDTTDGLRVELSHNTTDARLDWTVDGPATARGVAGYSFAAWLRADTDSESPFSVTETWTLACTAEGVWRIEGTTDADTRTTVVLEEPALVLPASIAEGTTWTERGVRGPNWSDGGTSVSVAGPSYQIQHTVTGCIRAAVPPTGNATVCTVSSEDEAGYRWTWGVAENIGLVDQSGFTRLWVTL